MPDILVDAGPLIALIDRRDAHHRECVKVFEGIRSTLLTSWPVISEAVHLLAIVPGAVDAVWEMLEESTILRILPLEPADYPAMRQLMKKYLDIPMDLADASLVHLAERERLTTVFTLDRDFLVYRVGRTGRFTVLPG